jgi:hypothetical protein
MIPKPKLHSHTYCQVAPAVKQVDTWKRVCLSHRTTKRQSERKTEWQQLTAIWPNDVFCASYQHLWQKSATTPSRKTLAVMIKDRQDESNNKLLRQKKWRAINT